MLTAEDTSIVDAISDNCVASDLELKVLAVDYSLPDSALELTAFVDEQTFNLPFFEIVSKTNVADVDTVCGEIGYSLVVQSDGGATVDATFAILIEGRNELKLKPVTNE